MGKYTLSRITSLFHKFGGLRLIKAYARLGVLGKAIKECSLGLIRRRSVDQIYFSFHPQILKILQGQYMPFMEERLICNNDKSLPHNRSNIVWFCWLQGIEKAPLIVRICLESLKNNLTDKDIRIIDESNRHQYVTFPNYIENRWKKKQIPPAQFSDLLRLELLIQYGGTWIDSTVLCTGFGGSGVQGFKDFLDADLFFFQFKRDKDALYAGVSNWFITSCQNNPLLMTLRDMLYAYWKDYDCVLEYFIFHRFFDLIATERFDEVSKMPYAYSPNSLALGHNWGRTFKQQAWDRLVSGVAFHKLSYKIEDSVVNDKTNYYNYIIREYSTRLRD